MRQSQLAVIFATFFSTLYTPYATAGVDSTLNSSALPNTTMTVPTVKPGAPFLLRSGTLYPIDNLGDPSGDPALVLIDGKPDNTVRYYIYSTQSRCPAGFKPHIEITTDIIKSTSEDINDPGKVGRVSSSITGIGACVLSMKQNTYHFSIAMTIRGTYFYQVTGPNTLVVSSLPAIIVPVPNQGAVSRLAPDTNRPPPISLRYALYCYPQDMDLPKTYCRCPSGLIYEERICYDHDYYNMFGI